MEQRILHSLVVMAMYLVSLGFIVGMCSDSESPIMDETYVSSSSSFPLSSEDSAHNKVEVRTITGKEWQLVVTRALNPVIVMFMNQLCIPCKQQREIVNQLASEVAGKFDFYLLDTSVDQDIAVRYEITSVPSYFVFKDGNEMGNMTGVKSYAVLREVVRKYSGV